MSSLSFALGKSPTPARAQASCFSDDRVSRSVFSAGALAAGFCYCRGVDTGWETIRALVFRPRVAELLSNTLWLIALTVPLCIALGVGTARLTERTLLAGRRLWSVLAVAPLAIPAFVQSYARSARCRQCTACLPGCFFRCWPITRLSICRLPPFCGGWTRRWKMLPPHWVRRRGGSFPRGFAAAQAGDMRRRAAGGAASAGGVRPVRDGPFRYLYHRHL